MNRLKERVEYSTLKPIGAIDLDNNAREIFTRRYALKGTDGKPLLEATINAVFDCPCACEPIDDTSEVSTAVEEKFRLTEPGSPAAIILPYLW